MTESEVKRLRLAYSDVRHLVGHAAGNADARFARPSPISVKTICFVMDTVKSRKSLFLFTCFSTYKSATVFF